jgi:hypothetical protein
MPDSALKIDGYAHISPPRYNEILKNEFPGFYRQILAITPPMYDMGARFKVMTPTGRSPKCLPLARYHRWSISPLTPSSRPSWPDWPTTRWRS